MAEEAKGKIILAGFKLDPAEKAIVDNLVANYNHKISEKIRFKEIKIMMKKAEHGKVFLHQIKGTMITNRKLNAEAEDYNLFAALSDVFEKLMNEAQHNQRTARQNV